MMQRRAALNLDAKLYIGADGTMGVVTTMIDIHGEETDRVDEAVCVVIALENGKFVTELVGDFEKRVLH